MSKVDAAKFVLECQNWFETALPIATHKIPARIILRNGIRFESQSIFWVDIYVIFSQRIYTPDYLPIEKDDVVVDIGANIGVFTVYAAFKTRNTVYAYEPFPDNYNALEQNVRSNALSNVKAYRLAVSDKIGLERFFNSGTSQHHHLEKVTPGVTKKYMEVPSITLRDIMYDNHLAQIDFLKMDCEGSEGIILRSTLDDDLGRIRKIAMEFHDHLSEFKHDQIRSLLERVGFTTRLVWDGKSKLGYLYAWRG